MAQVVVSLDVVLPVLNEEKALPATVGTLCDFLSRCLSGYDWRVVIADNGSTDDTQAIGTQLADELPRVGYTRLEERGRGIALRTAWLASTADIVAYMDVDLSADVGAFPRLLAAIDGEGYEIAIGSRLRLKEGSTVSGRSAKRELFARSYSLLFRALFLTGFQDAQCGFKALSRRAANDLLPLVRSSGWFFDTELLLLAEKERLSHQRASRRLDRRPRLASTGPLDRGRAHERTAEAPIWGTQPGVADVACPNALRPRGTCPPASTLYACGFVTLAITYRSLEPELTVNSQGLGNG